jgi:hypothetical protein
VDEVKRKVRSPKPSLKHRDKATCETVAGEEAGFPDELEAELMVTRICDGILRRLDRNEAGDDETKTQRPRRLTR